MASIGSRRVTGDDGVTRVSSFVNQQDGNGEVEIMQAEYQKGNPKKTKIRLLWNKIIGLKENS